MFDITHIIEAVFALISLIITVLIVPYIRSKTTASQQAEIDGWVEVVVAAAEQIYVGSGRGAEKKVYVVNWLKAHKVVVDDDKLDALIEAAVYKLKKGLLSQAAPPSTEDK